MLDCGEWSVEQGKISQDRTLPYIWFRRASTIQQRTLSGATLNSWTTEFDIEVCSLDIDCQESMTQKIKSDLMDFALGSLMEGTWIKGLNVFEHSDEYVPRSLLETDTGIFVGAFRIQIFHCQ